MLSGTGRHRRPRQAPAVLVTAGMTGAGLAMPLLGATSAQAADTDTWDRVAQCESGGLWSANSGNGYYGGLQLTTELWEEYGGTAYAERPDLASRSQQIAVAEKILADRGPEAWPSCSVNSGLTYDSLDVAPDIDPDNLLPPVPPAGSADGPPDGPSDSSADGSSDSSSDGSSDSSSDGDASAGAERGPAAGTEDPRDVRDGDLLDLDLQPDLDADAGADGDADARTGTGRHRGEPDPRESELVGEGELVEEGEPVAGVDAEAGTGTAVDDRAADDRTDRTARGDAADAPSDDYRVRPGDSLSAIAAEQGLQGGWAELYQANQTVVGGDPDLILPGQELRLG